MLSLSQIGQFLSIWTLFNAQHDTFMRSNAKIKGQAEVS